MMEELSYHIIDIVENSAAAGANLIEITIDKQSQKDLLIIEITDNGSGMTEEEIKKALDPFYTTRSWKKVGLGLPLLKQGAEQCNGMLKIFSKPGNGTKVSVKFQLSHIDLPPIGDLITTIETLIAGHADINLILHVKNDNMNFNLDTNEIKNVLGDDVPINDPEVLKFIRNSLREELTTINFI